MTRRVGCETGFRERGRGWKPLITEHLKTTSERRKTVRFNTVIIISKRCFLLVYYGEDISGVEPRVKARPLQPESCRGFFRLAATSKARVCGETY